jgi:predicted nucleic acid-binding protein
VILLDTSIWVDHFRGANAVLREVLGGADGGVHPFVVGELALGQLRRRDDILGLLESLPQLPVASHEDVMNLVDLQDLAGTGIGWVDAHLLSAARLQGWTILTLDRRLQQLAARLGIAAARQVATRQRRAGAVLAPHSAAGGKRLKRSTA